MFLCSWTIFLLQLLHSITVFMLKMFCIVQTCWFYLYVLIFSLILWHVTIYIVSRMSKCSDDQIIRQLTRWTWLKPCHFYQVSGLINVTQLLRLNASSPLSGENHPRGGRQWLISLKHTLLIKQTSIIKEKKEKGDAPAIPVRGEVH